MNPDYALVVLDDVHGAPHPTAAEYVRRFWMPFLGPTPTALLQLLARNGQRFWKIEDVTVRLGIHNKRDGGRDKLAHALDRLVNFRVAILDHNDIDAYDTITIGAKMPNLPDRFIGKLPDAVAIEHSLYLAHIADALGPRPTDIARRSGDWTPPI